MQVATHPVVEELLRSDAPVAIGVSGGKDSQAAALATFRHLDKLGHSGPRILIHADLGMVEWKDSLRICLELADHLQCDLVTVQRKGGGLMERWESRWISSRTRYEVLSTVTLVPCWSTPGMRFCTSEQKTKVICAELNRRFKGQTIINVTGVRREESAARSRQAVADLERTGRIWTWRPIIDLTVDQVFSLIDDSGLEPHPAYRDFGMSRVSCRWCIMSSLADMIAAAKQPEGHGLFRRMVRLEINSGFAFQGSRWLGDIAPEILTGQMRDELAAAKAKASQRASIEKQITKDMLYVSGWPLRMLTNDEAEILASVRQQVSALYRFNSDCLDVDSIHGRYADLLAEKTRKAAA